MTTLHVLALTTDADLRHTHLTRAQGDGADLPDLAGWLGVDTLDTDEIEVFPVKDLGDLSLSDYVSMAFALEAIRRQDRARMDALEGTVLLVPDTAIPAPPEPGANATLVTSLPLTKPDHDAVLPKAALTPLTADAPTPEAPRKGISPMLLWLIAGKVVLIGVIVALVMVMMR